MKDSRKFRFTLRAIETLPPHFADSPSREKEYSDAEVIGLRLLVSKNGRKFFHLRYRFNSRKRVVRIGEFPAISLPDARQQANEFKNMIARGIDPLDERDKKSDVLTFKDFTENEYMPHAKDSKKSWQDDRNKLQADMIPTFGKLQLSAITTRDIQQYGARIKGRSSQSTANRHLSLLRRMFNLAVQWQFIEKNPCDPIQKFKENGGRERFLDKDEIKRFLSALERNDNRITANAIKFLLFTGLRLSEALGMEWQNVNLASSTAYLSTTKSGKGRNVMLNGLAVKVLEEMKEYQTNGFVFPGKGVDGHMTNLRKVFDAVKAETGIKGLRIHDLRHTYASLAVNGGSNLYEVQKLLGHSSSQMTQRYAHLSDRAVRDATDTVAAQIEQAAG